MADLDIKIFINELTKTLEKVNNNGSLPSTKILQDLFKNTKTLVENKKKMEADIKKLSDSIKNLDKNSKKESEMVSKEEKILDSEIKISKEETITSTKVSKKQKELSKEYIKAEETLDMFNKQVESLTNEHKSLADSFKLPSLPSIGGAITGALALVAATVGTAYDFIKDLDDVYKNLANNGLFFENGLVGLRKLSTNSVITFGELTDLMKNNAVLFSALGTRGTRAFTENINSISGNIKMMASLGLTFEEATEITASYMDTLRVSGLLQSLSQKEQESAISKYIYELSSYSNFFGKSRDEIAKSAEEILKSPDAILLLQSMTLDRAKRTKAKLDTLATAFSSFDPKFGQDIMKVLFGSLNFTGLANNQETLNAITKLGIFPEINKLVELIKSDSEGSAAEITDLSVKFLESLSKVSTDQLVMLLQGNEDLIPILANLKNRDFEKLRKDLLTATQSQMALETFRNSLRKIYDAFETMGVSLFEKIEPKLEPLFEKFSTYLSGLTDKIFKLVESFDKILSDNPQEREEGIKIIKENLINPLLDLMSKALDSVGGFLSSMIDSVSSNISDFMNKVYEKILDEILPWRLGGKKGPEADLEVKKRFGGLIPNPFGNDFLNPYRFAKGGVISSGNSSSEIQPLDTALSILTDDIGEKTGNELSPIFENFSKYIVDNLITKNESLLREIFGTSKNSNISNNLNVGGDRVTSPRSSSPSMKNTINTNSSNLSNMSSGGGISSSILGAAGMPLASAATAISPMITPHLANFSQEIMTNIENDGFTQTLAITATNIIEKMSNLTEVSKQNLSHMQSLKENAEKLNQETSKLRNSTSMVDRGCE